MEDIRSQLQRALAQLRIEITFPYALLAFIVAFAAALLVTRLLGGILEDRFQTVLLDAGFKVTDTVVRQEQEQLNTWRAIAYTQGFAEAVAVKDKDAIGLLASPLVLNARLDSLEVLDNTGSPLVTMHHRGSSVITDYAFDSASNYKDWDSVQNILNGQADEFGDKYAELVETHWGWTFYTAGPIKHHEQVVGVLLVGTYLDQLVQRLDKAALARVSIYAGSGPPLVTTLAPEERDPLALSKEAYELYLAGQAERVPRRDVDVARRKYAEVFGAFEARYGQDLGIFSVALPLSFVTDAQHPTRQSLLFLFGLATVLIVLVGAFVANFMVRRVRNLATATREVARGNLDTQVRLQGYDEISSLADDFNRMVAQLREGQLYRDLLGLTTSPEVAARLREQREKGEVQLQAQSTVATILFADIRGFTSISEGKEPAYVVNLLNEFLQGIVRGIRQHHGIINKFIGDAALAFFGVLPEARPPQKSAYDAVVAALAMLSALKELNQKRCERGDDPIRIGVGINTGAVVAGLLGSEERFEYTVLGDTVNIAQRLSDLNKKYPEYSVFVEAETWHLLGDTPPVDATYLGDLPIAGRTTRVGVYAI